MTEQNVALLPLPEWTKRDDAGQNMVPSELRVAMADYARANVTAALASAQAREDELRALLGGVECQRDANWQAYTKAEARAERLAEALREARDYVASELSDERAKFAGYEHCSSIASIEADLARIDAALSTNAATQTGETNEAAE